MAIPPALDIPLGKVIKAWREYRGLSVTEFAARAGIPKAYVSELEHLKIDRPGTKRMGELAAGLDLDYWDLVERRFPPTGAEDKTPATAAVRPPGLRRAGGFAFAAPLTSAAISQQVDEGDDERALRQLSDQVDEMRRTLDTLLARKTGSRDDNGAS